MKLITNVQQKSYQNAFKKFYKKFEDKHAKDKNYCKVRDHCHYTDEYRGASDSICNSKFSISKEIPVVFHNGSNYIYHFIIKELAEKFEKIFTCLGESTDKCITSSVPIQKEV